MTAFWDIGLVGVEPSLVSCEIGILSAIECTPKPLVALTPAAGGTIDARCRFCSGRRSPRSKIAPRST